MYENVDILIGAAVALACFAGALLLWCSVRARRARREEAPSSAAVPSARTPTEPASPLTAFREGLAKTRSAFGARLLSALGRDHTLTAWLSDLEEALILADVGMPTTQRLVAALRQRGGLDSPSAVLDALKAEIRDLLRNGAHPEPDARPLVILVAGVNGVGKTTTIGKLAYRYRQQGKKVMVIAADTFRAAAIEQLEIWAKRVECDLVKHQSGADPSAVVFDGIKAARSRGIDVAIVDTAGRLHVKVNLMEELKKLVRVIRREMPDAPHEAFLVLDGTTGQNALSQARQFREALPLSGVIVTKLDGTAKGGAVLAIKRELGLPVRYVGLGERLEDLRPFEPDAFTDALFESSPGRSA